MKSSHFTKLAVFRFIYLLLHVSFMVLSLSFNTITQETNFAVKNIHYT